MAQRWRNLVVFLLTFSLLVGGAASLADAGARPDGRTRRVGTQKLAPCKGYKQTWCGFLSVPLDRDDPGAATLKIGYAWRPARKAARGTLVANEGGPGYPSLTSMSLWTGMYGDLLQDFNLLVVDARGTGKSHAINCQALQNLGGTQTESVFFAAIAECGEQLNRTYRHKAGGYVHASDLFGTVDAVDDMAAVIDALGVGPVDLYGDSYGSFFAQAFAARHPAMLRSLTLDGTWPLVDANPWYPETPATLRFAFDAVCKRSAACAAAAPGSATARLRVLADALDAAPLSGQVARPGKKPEAVTVKGPDIAALAWSAGSDGTIYRELDAAGRATLAGDGAPLLRLAARTGLNGSLAGGWAANQYSVGHAVGVPCTDYPQPFDMMASPAERAAQYNAAVAVLPNDAFAPFSNQQWLTNPIQDYNQCVPWPAPTHARELAPDGFPLVPPGVPVLILAGDLDSVTALSGAEIAAQQLGPSARLVVFPNSTHVVAQGDVVGCGSSILRAFLRDPARLMALDVSCKDRFPEIHAVGAFPRVLAQQVLPAATAGNAASETEQRLAALAVATAGDAVTFAPRRGKKAPGLRGGSIAGVTKKRGKKGPLTLKLAKVRYAEDAVVSGTVVIPKDPHGVIVAKLTAVADSGERVKLTATWSPLVPGAAATVQGTAGKGTPLRVTMPAP
jgi:pimeloyl-ACP methyl ester carboxylesterase